MKQVITFMCIALSVFVTAQNTWEKKAAFGNDKRSRSVSFSIGNRGYVGFGEDTADQVRNDFWEYDPGTDTWAQRASLPAAGRRDAVGFAIGTKGYVGTGIDAAESQFGNNLNDWWEYNPATNTWLQRATFPGSSSWGGIYFGCGFVCNGMGYVVGGKQGNSNYTNNMFRYNPTSNSWTQMAQFPGGTRYAMTAFSINSKAYVGLGTDENILQNDWWEYDPVTNTWLQKGNFPGSGRFAAAGFTIGQKGYVLGGTDGGYKDELWQYDAPTDSWWVKAPYDGGPRRSMAVFVIANAAYAGTGSGFTGKRRDFWQYQQFLTGIEQMSFQAPDIFPNPVENEFVLTSPIGMHSFPEEAWMSIISAEGKIVIQQNIGGLAQVKVNASALAPGIYTIQVSNGQWHAQTSLLKK